MKLDSRWLLLIPVLLVAIGLGIFVPRLLDGENEPESSIIEEGRLSGQAEEEVNTLLDEIENYERLLDSTPNDVEILKPLGDNYFTLAKLELQSGLTNDSFEHYKAAVDVYRRILEINPEAEAVRLSLGLAYDGLLMRQVAIRELRSVQSSDPYTLFDLAGAFNQVGLPADAKTSLDAIKTDDPELLINVGLEYVEDLQLFAEAEASVRRATEIDPDNQRGWLTLGYILKTAGNESEADSAFQTAIDLNPDSPIADEARGFLGS